jgi:4-hydroxy-tetrahydrodipicolinate synthase
LEYVEDIVPELPLPVFLYNMPSHTKLTFELETLRRALDLANVAGLKDSSAQMIYFHQVRRLTAARPGFSLLVGPEELLAESVLAGAQGGVNGGANLFPRLYVDLYEAARRAQLDRVAALHAQVMRLGETIYSVGKHRSAFIKGLKCGLACLGICDDFMAEPFQRFHDAQRKQIERYLAELGVSPANRALQAAR